MIDNIEQRKRRSKLDWPTGWDDDRCYGKSLIDKIKKWLNDDSIYPFEDPGTI